MVWSEVERRAEPAYRVVSHLTFVVAVGKRLVALLLERGHILGLLPWHAAWRSKKRSSTVDGRVVNRSEGEQKRSERGVLPRGRGVMRARSATHQDNARHCRQLEVVGWTRRPPVRRPKLMKYEGRGGRRGPGW